MESVHYISWYTRDEWREGLEVLRSCWLDKGWRIKHQSLASHGKDNCNKIAMFTLEKSA